MVFFERKKDVLTVSILEDTVFVQPSIPPTSLPFASQEPTSDDPLLKGTVTLVCHAPRRAQRIRVELLGIAAKHGGDSSFSFEQQETLRKSVEIELKGERLDPGTHTWDFSFIIPSSTAVSERSVYGTVRHSVRAVLHGGGSFRDVSSMIKPVWLIANTAPAGELPSGLEIDVRHPVSDLGPISLHISSPHLTVASLIFLGVSFEQPPPGLKIMSMQAFVRQEFEIHYSNKEVPVQHPPIQRKLLFYADSTTPVPTSTEDLLDRPNLSRGAPPPLPYEPRMLLPQPLARLEGGKEWTYARVTRIPDDDSVRPTTLDGTDTPIRAKHALVCQVKYRFKGSKKDQVLEMASNVTIASCCCLTSSLLLPEYRSRHHLSHCTGSARPRSGSLSAADSLSAAAGGTPIGIDSPTGVITPFHRRCLCNTPLATLVQNEGEKLAGAAESRSRSRAGDASSRSRSASCRRMAGSSAEASEVEDSEAGGSSGRGRDARRRKIGETFPVANEPSSECGIEEIPPARQGETYVPVRSGGGSSWSAQGDALRPARRQGGTSMTRVAGAQERGQVYVVV